MTPVLFAAFFGTIVGSYLNVLVLRYHTGRSAGGRSGCLSCGKVLSWYELVPLASYFLQKGRCRGCLSRISMHYPLVEGVTALLFIGIILLDLPLRDTLLSMLFTALAVAVAAYDLRHQIIPDGLVYTMIAVGGVLALLRENVALTLLSSFAIAAFFALLWLYSKGRWIGLGDAKLAFALGLFLGYPGNVNTVILSFWIGMVVSLALLGLQRVVHRLPFGNERLTIKSEIPFAPFLLAGAYLIFFFGFKVINLSFS